MDERTVKAKDIKEESSHDCGCGRGKERKPDFHLGPCTSDFPEHPVVSEIVQICRRLLFSGYYGSCQNDSARLDDLLECQLRLAFQDEEGRERIPDIMKEFISSFPKLHRLLESDVKATYDGDPAATSIEEVVLCYPGIYAVTNHRIAHRLYELGVPLIPRMISEQAHSRTGIDIHPAATIGSEFMIDHGTGVVIGATAIIGRHVKIYQGVTLGARSFTLDDAGNPVKGVARHPIVGNNVVIYSNSTVLGRVTVGDDAVIGGNLWVTRDVAPGEKLVQAKPDNLIRSVK